VIRIISSTLVYALFYLISKRMRLVSLMALLLATSHTVLASSRALLDTYNEPERWNWQCQTPGKYAYCFLVCEPGCFEGPFGFEGGCGFCRFCASEVMPDPECLSTTGRSFGSYSGQPGAIVGGEVLVQNVNSWFFSQTVHSPPKVTTAVQCAQACGELDGCNAWQFCYGIDGCGAENECSAIGKANGNSDSCSLIGPHGGCQRDGRFPPLTCTLKRINLTNAVTQGPQNDGWNSGTIKDISREQRTYFVSNALSCLIN